MLRDVPYLPFEFLVLLATPAVGLAGALMLVDYMALALIIFAAAASALFAAVFLQGRRAKATAPLLNSRLDEVMAAHEAGATHDEIAAVFTAEGHDITAADIREFTDDVKQRKARDEARQRSNDAEEARKAQAATALSALSANLRTTMSP